MQVVTRTETLPVGWVLLAVSTDGLAMQWSWACQFVRDGVGWKDELDRRTPLLPQWKQKLLYSFKFRYLLQLILTGYHEMNCQDPQWLLQRAAKGDFHAWELQELLLNALLWKFIVLNEVYSCIGEGLLMPALLLLDFPTLQQGPQMSSMFLSVFSKGIASECCNNDCVILVILIVFVMICQPYLYCTAADGSTAVYHKRPFSTQAATKLLEPKPQTLCFCSNLSKFDLYWLPSVASLLWCCDYLIAVIRSGAYQWHFWAWSFSQKRMSLWCCFEPVPLSFKPDLEHSKQIWCILNALFFLPESSRMGESCHWLIVASLRRRDSRTALNIWQVWSIGTFLQAHSHIEPSMKRHRWCTVTKGKLQSVPCSLPLFGCADSDELSCLRFYDHVHTTGLDVHQAPYARAALTLGPRPIQHPIWWNLKQLTVVGSHLCQ